MLSSKPMHHASTLMALIWCLLAVVSLLCPTLARTTPVANDDAYSVPSGQTLNITDAESGVLANDYDTDGDALSAILVSNSANGQLNFNSDGTFSYTPNTGFSGRDTFTYSATNGQSTSAPATVYLTVKPTYLTPQDTTLTINATASAQLFFATFTPNAQEAGVVVAPFWDYPTFYFKNYEIFGDVTLAQIQNIQEGMDYYNAIIAWQVNIDPDAQTYADAHGIPIITATQLGDLWNALYQALVSKQGGVLANSGANTLTAQQVTGPANGQLTLNADGSFTYTPNPGFWGADRFSYTTTDG